MLLCPIKEKKLLFSVKHYFDGNRMEFRSSDTAAQMAADALIVGLLTVNRVMASYLKTLIALMLHHRTTEDKFWGDDAKLDTNQLNP